MAMTSRERVRAALNHQQPDRIPIDLGANCCTGIHAVEYPELRKGLGLEPKIPKNLDAMMCLAYVDRDIQEALDVDCIGIDIKTNGWGVRNENWKLWHFPNGAPMYVGGDFAWTRDENGVTYAYPQGDTSVPPSGYMPTTGFYYDLTDRQEDLDAKTVWNAREDYKDDYTLLTDEDLKELEDQATYFYNNTDKSLFGSYWKAGLGDNLLAFGPWLKEVKGVRKLQDWYLTILERPEYIRELFEMQTEVSIENMKLWYQAVGNKIDCMGISGTDWGCQNGLLISLDVFRELYKPYYQKVCDWIHQNTEWKVWMHSCGSVTKILPDLIEMGIDVINPVQCSAKDMDAKELKAKFGDDIVFWGGGCNQQKTLVTGTPEECYEETKHNAEILGKGGGLIGCNVHNLQYGVPIENYLAEMQAFKDVRF